MTYSLSRRKLSVSVLIVIALSSCLQMESTRRTKNKKADTTEVVDYVIQEYSAESLLGKKLYPPKLSSRDESRREVELSKALENFKSKPDSLDYIIWFGRRLGYLYFYKEAIQVFTDGIEKFPLSYELFRHRGHRFLTIREFDKAIVDLEKAAFYVRNTPVKMERNGREGRRIPRALVQFYIWYHLGLSYYLKGNYDKAVSSYKKCLELSNNDDMLVSATDWLYMTYRRLGNAEAADELLEPIKRRMNVIENKTYHRKLLMYKGIIRPSELFTLNQSEYTIDELTYGYGVGNWYFYHGDTKQAFQIFNQMMSSSYWPAFGFLAAEVEIVNRQGLK